MRLPFWSVRSNKQLKLPSWSDPYIITASDFNWNRDKRNIFDINHSVPGKIKTGSTEDSVFWDTLSNSLGTEWFVSPKLCFADQEAVLSHNEAKNRTSRQSHLFTAFRCSNGSSCPNKARRIRSTGPQHCKARCPVVTSLTNLHIDAQRTVLYYLYNIVF